MKKQSQYETWKKIHNFSTSKDNRKQFEVVERVRKELSQAENARKTNCYWTTNTTDNGEENNVGWNYRWDLQEKQWLMWYAPSDSDDFKSNVKLPETTGRVESTFAKIKKINLVWDALPNDPGDVEKAKVVKLLMDYIFYASDLSKYIATWSKSSLIHGSGFARWVYQRKIREYSYPQTDATKMTAEEKAMVKEKKVVWKSKEKKTKYEGFALIPIPSQEFYVDPQALCLHGNNKEARWAIWRRIVHIADFKGEFAGDPNCQNVDKVKATGSYASLTKDYTFFQPPHDIQEPDLVEVLEYENQMNDEYIIIANDILIRNTPLPYEHKELTFHKIDTIEHPNQFYGIGIPDFLLNIQGAAEVMLNMMIDTVYKGLNRKYLVDNNIYGEFTDSYARNDAQFIPVSNPGQQPLTSKIQPLPYEPLTSEPFNILAQLAQYATMASGIDPAQMNLQMPNRTATATAISKDIIETMINSIVDNMGVTMVDIGRQTWSMIKQMWSVPKVQTIIGDDGKEENKDVPRSIRIEGKQIIDEGGKITMKDSKQKYNFLTIKPDYFDTAADMDIRISPDSMEVVSKAYTIQKTQQAYAQMMPNAVDPTDPLSAQMPIVKIYDARKLGKQLVETLNFDEEVLLQPDFDEEEDLELAKSEMADILKGKQIVGIPGRSDKHIQYEAAVLNGVNGRIDMLYKTLSEQAQPVVDPQTGMPLPGGADQAVQAEYDNLRNVQLQLAAHLDVDRTPEVMGDEKALTDLCNQQQVQQAAQQPPQQPPVPMPGQGMIPQGMGSMGSDIQMPQDMGVQQMMPQMGGGLQ